MTEKNFKQKNKLKRKKKYICFSKKKNIVTNIQTDTQKNLFICQMYQNI